jgi:6-pyruvoyltetrahydropterin/6-carboxytetrahydropterin synthase
MPAKASSTKTARRAARPAAAPSGAVYVTRQVHFNAAHRLHNPRFGKAWNDRTYGPCANPNWHGHNYVLEATVAGVPDPDTGFVINLAGLKRILIAAVVEPCDHRNLNREVPFLRGVIPTAENLAIAFWGRIERLLGPGRLHSVRLYETPRNFAEYLGPNE